VKHSKISSLSLGLWLASVGVGCGVAVSPVIDGGADRPSADAVISPTDVTTLPPRDGALACRAAMPARVFVPEVLFAGQPLGLTVEVSAAGCGCALSLVPNGLSSARGFDPMLCNCCEDCECIDSGYRASALLGAPAVGSSEIAVSNSGRRTVQVVASESACDRDGIEVREVTVHGPDAFTRSSGPSLYWVEVSGLHRPCCGGDVGFVDSMQGNAFNLSPRSCDLTLCDRACPPVERRMPVQFTATHLLGELRPGDYRVTVQTSTVTFTVR
jgi:hypothetical protein